MDFIGTVHRVEDKVRRELLQLPVVSSMRRKSYEQAALLHQKSLPNLSVSEQIIVDKLRHDGAYKTTFDNLVGSSTSEFTQLCDQSLSDPSQLVFNGNNMQAFPLAKLKHRADILRWGLENKLLNIVESYVGLPIYYLGVEIKKELANGNSGGVRQWHLDTEDYRMIKVIVYLTDVDTESGPFEYLPRYKSNMVVAGMRYKSGLISDDVLQQYVPASAWCSCIGSKYTAVIVDPASVLHRAKPATNTERRSVTFHYISQKPLHLRKKNLSITKIMQHRYPDLSERQLSCLVA